MSNVIPLQARLADSFANLLAGLGVGNAKTAAHTYVPSYGGAELEAAYRTSTWFGKIVDIPADDATREWRSWQADDPQIEAMDAEEKRLGVVQKVRQALIWERLYGGSAIIPGGLPGLPGEPLAVDRIGRGGLQFLTVVPKGALTAGEVIRNPLDPHYGQPSYYEISTEAGGQTRLHPSRVIRFGGRRVAATITETGDSWGDSVWLHLQSAIKASDAAAAVVNALMVESKVDVVRIKNLTEHLLTAEATNAYTKRWQLVAELKSVNNIMMLDGDDEWEQKQITWTGIPDVVQMLLTIMAGAADIPMTRLTGVQAKGLNNGGEIDLRNYYDMVRARQVNQIEPAITPLDEMLIRSALGARPPEIWYRWRPLWQPSAKEAAETDKQRADTVKTYVEAGAVPRLVAHEMAKGALVESGNWPGVDAAYADAAALEPTPEEVAAAEQAPDEE